MFEPMFGPKELTAMANGNEESLQAIFDLALNFAIVAFPQAKDEATKFINAVKDHQAKNHQRSLDWFGSFQMPGTANETGAAQPLSPEVNQ